MKKKSLITTVLFLLGCFFVLSSTASVFAEPKADENKVVIREPTKDVDTLYKNYKDNSFELMTEDKEDTSLTGLKEALTNSTAMVKNFTWAGVKMTGNFNAEMVKFLFSMDVITPIKKPIQKLTANIAGNMLSIAGSIGIGIVTMIMVIKFLGEQRFRQALRVFLMAILIFTGLAICKDADTSDSLFTTMFDADKQIEAAFVDINPVLSEDSPKMETTYKTRDRNGNEVTEKLSAKGRMKNAGDLIASRVFYTNVYEPYLLVNYGTSNPDNIRKKKVKYKEKDYDRINILLDNDVSKEENEDLHEEVTKHEADKLKNRHVQYYNNLTNSFYAIFYFFVNLIQMFVYFILCFLRLIISVMQVFLLPLLPILLLVGLFMSGINVFMNYFKAFGMTIFMKAMVGFACIFFASFLSLGFQLSNAVDNPWQKILTILIYLLTPIGLWIFRTFLGSLFTGRVSLADAASFIAKPFGTEKKIRDAAKERKKESQENRKLAKEQRKGLAQKRKEDAKKRGKQELGMKEKPVTQRENKRSALRRELPKQAQHKTPNSLEKAQQKMGALHDQAQNQEAKDAQQVAQKQHRKNFDKENLQTAAALSAMNQSLEKQPKTTERRTGQSTHQRKAEGLGTSPRRQGQRPSETGNANASRRKTGAKEAESTTKTNQRRTTSNRSNARTQARVTGKKPENVQLTPKSNPHTQARSYGGNGSSPKRQQASIREKKQAVQQVIQHQAPRTNGKSDTPNVPKPITRMAKKATPTVKEPRPKKSTIRREKAASPTKGMKRPRARK